MKTNSLIWKIGLFEKSADGKQAECKECKKFLKLPAGSTKSLRTHLLSLHKNTDYSNQYNELEGKLKESAKEQPTIEASLKAGTSLTSSGNNNILIIM